MSETTYGYAEIHYTLDNSIIQQYRVSSVIKEGNWFKRFINEIETFVYSIELKNPIKLNVLIGVYLLNDNTTTESFNTYLEVC